MGLYIKGMKMPKDDVHAFKRITITNNWVDGEVITLAHDTITNEFIGEVVEVPEPHGRLIDAEKAIEEMDDIKRNNILVESPLDIERCKCVCRHTLTIIEAEE